LYGNNLKVKKIISIFLFFEHLCFEVFKENLNDEYIEEIDNRIKDKIIDNLVNNENNKIYLKQLAASIRRFISRYIYRINNQEEFSPKGKLIIHLKKRIDLWDKDLRNSEKIEKILELIKEYDLNVGQGLKLYELIKEEDPDIMTQWNGFGFDDNYIHERIMRLTGIKKFDNGYNELETKEKRKILDIKKRI